MHEEPTQTNDAPSPTPSFLDLLEVLRTLPEAGALQELEGGRVETNAKKVLAVLKSQGKPEEVSVLIGAIELLYASIKKDMDADAVRLGMWCAYREMLRMKGASARLSKALTHAWNGVAPRDFIVRIGRSSKASPHKGDICETFYDLDATGRLRRPVDSVSTADILLSRLAVRIGYSMSAMNPEGKPE